MSKYGVLKDNLKSLVGEEFEKTLPIIAGDYEDKIKRQAEEITRLLAENKKLKEAKTEDIEHWCDVCTKQSIIEQARAEGQNEAWELVRKIFDMESEDKIQEAFNLEYSFALTVIEQITYPEAAAKVEAWEKAKEEIKVGDVLEDVASSNVKCVVTNMYPNNMAYLVFSDGSAGKHELEKMKRTGRHIDIEGLLKQIGGEKNEGNL